MPFGLTNLTFDTMLEVLSEVDSAPLPKLSANATCVVVGSSGILSRVQFWCSFIVPTIENEQKRCIRVCSIFALNFFLRKFRYPVADLRGGEGLTLLFFSGI